MKHIETLNEQEKTNDKTKIFYAFDIIRYFSKILNAETFMFYYLFQLTHEMKGMRKIYLVIAFLIKLLRHWVFLKHGCMLHI